MWSLKPYHSPPSLCPGCGIENPGFDEYLITGQHILGKGTCNGCGLLYYHNWPIAHGADFPVAFDGNGIAQFSSKAAAWFAHPLIKTIKEDRKIDCRISRIIKKDITQGLLLNCLDPCYGHVLWKLFNASYHQQTDYPQGLIVLIPDNFEWLVPEYVAEVWSVTIPLDQINNQIASLQSFIREATRDYLSLKILPVHTHIDHSNLPLQQFLPVEPFPLEDYDRYSKCLTLLWREDRFWLRTKLEEWLGLVAVKYRISWIKLWLLYRQRQAMIDLITRIRIRIPNIRINVAGIGDYGSFPSFVEDLRCLKPDKNFEKSWCLHYAQSQLVIGVHGSNMLIPTALSAGFIELLPRNKIPFLAEDILMRHTPRFQTFLGRHLDIFSSPRLVAQHAISMLMDFQYLFRNTTQRP